MGHISATFPSPTASWTPPPSAHTVTHTVYIGPLTTKTAPAPHSIPAEPITISVAPGAASAWRTTTAATTTTTTPAATAAPTTCDGPSTPAEECAATITALRIAPPEKPTPASTAASPPLGVGMGRPPRVKPPPTAKPSASTASQPRLGGLDKLSVALMGLGSVASVVAWL